MKAIDIDRVATLNVGKASMSEVGGLYGSNEEGVGWFHWPNLWLMDDHPLPTSTLLPAFTACVVKYRYPQHPPAPEYGIHRRDSIRILNRAGLRPPTATEAFRLATMDKSLAGTDRFFRRIVSQNQGRRIVCPVPINPEFPHFFYFGMGPSGHGSFKRCMYEKLPDDSSLYHWTFRRSDEVGGPTELYQFPLLLGVEE